MVRVTAIQRQSASSCSVDLAEDGNERTYQLTNTCDETCRVMHVFLLPLTSWDNFQTFCTRKIDELFGPYGSTHPYIN